MSGAPDPQSPTLPLADNGAAPDPASHRSFAPSRRGWLKYPPIIIASIFLGGVIGMYFQPPGLRLFFGLTGLEPGAGTDTPIAIATQRVMSQQDVAVVSEGDVVALGRILPTGDVISIATPYGAGDARIATLNVAVGDRIHKGDVLAVLDNESQLQSAIDTARAALTVREATLAQTRAAINASLAEAQAALERSQATAAQAKADLTRATSLLERGVTTRAEFDQVVARATEAERDVERNLATLSRYASGSDTVQADIAVAEANAAAARVDITRTERNLAQAYVSAPADGTILNLNSRIGERPGPNGILDMGDTSQMTVEAEVYQSMIGRVAIGDAVSITAPALGEAALNGSVHAIGLEIGRQSITSEDPAANTDARVVDVIIWLDPASSDRAARYTNLEAVVRIDTKAAP